MRISRAGIVVAGCVVAGVLIGVLVRPTPSPYDTPREHRAQARAAGRWLSQTPSVPVSDEPAVAALLRRAERIPNQEGVYDPSPEMRDSLVALLSHWIRLRADADADAYIAWMQRRGEVWALSRPEGRKHFSMQDWDLRNAWKVYTGTEAPENLDDIDPEAFFRAAFTRSLEMGHGILRPTRVSARAQVVYQRIPMTRLDTRPARLENWPESNIWTGYAVSGDRPHWLAPATYGDVLRRDSVAFVAIFLVGLENSEGMWVPTRISAYYDIASAQWYIESVAYSNTRYEGVAVEW